MRKLLEFIVKTILLAVTCCLLAFIRDLLAIICLLLVDLLQILALERDLLAKRKFFTKMNLLVLQVYKPTINRRNIKNVGLLYVSYVF